MTRSKAVLVGAAALLLVSACFGQASLEFVGVGSSALTNSLAYAAFNSDCATRGTAPCNLWSGGGGSAVSRDGRVAGIPDETGTTWVVWDATAAPNTKIWAYIQTDSTVGVRSFMAAPRAAMHWNVAGPIAVGNKIPGLPDTAALPAAIITDLQDKTFNAAGADIRVEDAKYATNRACATPWLSPGTNGVEGYGPCVAGPGTPILRFDGGASFTPVQFGLAGKTDPYTGAAVPAIKQINVGAGPVVVVVNKTNAAGLATATNISRFVLARFLDGSFNKVQDITGGANPTHVNTWLREPLSGTYNTMEFDVARSFGASGSATLDTQERNVNPATMNPLNTADRKRSIGTGNEISNVSGTADSLGYAFWSYANLLPLSSVGANTGKYLTVDASDPLGNGGVIPTCGNPVAPPCPVVNFNEVANGAYPIWTIFRMVTASTVPTGVQNLVNAAQTEVTKVQDFLPIASVNVFRSHFVPAAVGGLTTPCGTAKNGNRAAPNNVENCGDAGGMPFFKQADLDYFATFAKELVALKQ